MFGCVSKSKYTNQIKILRTADVTADVSSAVSKKDFRFVGVMGFAMIVPGVPDYAQKYSDKYGVRLIENTSDCIEGPQHEELQRVAREYAEKYNRILLTKLPHP